MSAVETWKAQQIAPGVVPGDHGMQLAGCDKSGNFAVIGRMTTSPIKFIHRRQHKIRSFRNRCPQAKEIHTARWSSPAPVKPTLRADSFFLVGMIS
jgi:hypothetical protein